MLRQSVSRRGEACGASSSPALLEGPGGDGVQRLIAWLEHHALPLWGAHGDAMGLPFAECADFEGERIQPGYLRLRVAARQTVVYCEAAEQGASYANPLAVAGWELLLGRFWSTVSGWASRIGPYGQVTDIAFDLYDQAFAIYACAAWARLTGAREAVTMALRTMDLIDRRLKVRGRAGWRSRVGSNRREQNPHMHYLEALLALHPLMPVRRVAARIEEILCVLAQHLFDPDSGTIAEFFCDDWTPAGDGPVVEAGHLYEWWCLLREAEAQGFSVPVDADLLLAFADRAGWDQAAGLVYNRCRPDGTVLEPSFRLWPQCEALKALACSQRPDAPRRAGELAGRVLEIFLSTPRKGLWFDRLDERLEVTSTEVPASSLYHLWEAGRMLGAQGHGTFSWRRAC